MQALTLDRDGVAALVHTFYDAVRADAVLAPVFDAVIGDRWDTHLARMVDFWSTVMLGTKEFHGNVFGKHMALQGVEAAHFARWLTLFEQTAERLFSPVDASGFIVNARRIAASLQYGYYGKVVVPAAPAAEAA
jgi:hemoglobin